MGRIAKQCELKRARINRRADVRVVRTNARANDRSPMLTIDEPRRCNEALAARSHRPRIRHHDLPVGVHDFGDLLSAGWWPGRATGRVVAGARSIGGVCTVMSMAVMAVGAVGRPSSRLR